MKLSAFLVIFVVLLTQWVDGDGAVADEAADVSAEEVDGADGEEVHYEEEEENFDGEEEEEEEEEEHFDEEEERFEEEGEAWGEEEGEEEEWNEGMSYRLQIPQWFWSSAI
jgi:hypothetical protein